MLAWSWKVAQRRKMVPQSRRLQPAHHLVVVRHFCRGDRHRTEHVPVARGRAETRYRVLGALCGRRMVAQRAPLPDRYRVASDESRRLDAERGARTHPTRAVAAGENCGWQARRGRRCVAGGRSPAFKRQPRCTIPR
eukprot:363516-Chlamydomonas_euryale.AAC.11